VFNLRKLENHHVAGKYNSELTATLCVGDHIDLSNIQMTWDSRWTLTTNTENLKNSFIIQGIQHILLQKHYVTGNPEYRTLAYSLSPLVRRYREMP
jgi:hypothetical protein